MKTAPSNVSISFNLPHKKGTVYISSFSSKTEIAARQTLKAREEILSKINEEDKK